jgi:hypothetical protein
MSHTYATAERENQGKVRHYARQNNHGGEEPHRQEKLTRAGLRKKKKQYERKNKINSCTKKKMMGNHAILKITKTTCPR